MKITIYAGIDIISISIRTTRNTIYTDTDIITSLIRTNRNALYIQTLIYSLNTLEAEEEIY